MLRRANDILGFVLGARDGEIGRVKDLYFDDAKWTVRYIVADTGKWLALRQVLLTPHSIHGITEQEKIVRVDLTREEIEHSPPIEQDSPVSRQFEEDYYRYYNYPYYWDGFGIWGPLAGPVIGFRKGMRPIAPPSPGPAETAKRSEDSHLRSVEAVSGYGIQALDGEIGHVEDFVFDDEHWTIEYLVIDTRNWWSGKKVLVPPSWSSEVNWEESKLFLNLDRATIKGAPEYDTSSPITRDYEKQLFSYYNRDPYWSGRKAA
jgi:hypothetical protein